MDKKIILHEHSPTAARRQFRESIKTANFPTVSGKPERRASAEAVPTGIRLGIEYATLGEIFSFTSSLYFRGKLTYARAFGTAQSGLEACYLITSSRGLLLPDTLVDLAMLKELTAIAEVDPEDDRYRIPLERDAIA